MWVSRGFTVLCLATAMACSVGPASGVESPRGGGRDSGITDESDASRDPTGGTGGIDAVGGTGGTGGSDEDAGEPPPDSGPPDAAVDAGPSDAGPDNPDTCPGVPVTLSGSPLTAVFSESSADYAGDSIPTPACSTTSGDEAVYRLRAPKDGMLRVTLDTPSSGSSYPPQLYVRNLDCELGLELACDSRPSFLSNAVVEFPVFKGFDYYIFADETVVGTDGPFTLTFLYL